MLSHWGDFEKVKLSNVFFVSVAETKLSFFLKKKKDKNPQSEIMICLFLL